LVAADTFHKIVDLDDFDAWNSKDSFPYSRTEADIVFERRTQNNVAHILQMNVHDPVSEALDHLTVIGARRAGVARIQRTPTLSLVAAKNAAISSAFSTNIFK